MSARDHTTGRPELDCQDRVDQLREVHAAYRGLAQLLEPQQQASRMPEVDRFDLWALVKTLNNAFGEEMDRLDKAASALVVR